MPVVSCHEGQFAAVQIPRGIRGIGFAVRVARADADKIIRLPLCCSRPPSVPEVMHMVKLEKRRVDSMSHLTTILAGEKHSLLHCSTLPMSPCRYGSIYHPLAHSNRPSIPNSPSYPHAQLLHPHCPPMHSILIKGHPQILTVKGLVSRGETRAG